MAGNLAVLRVTSISSYHHATTPEKTIIQVVTAANRKVSIKEIAIGFRGVDTTAVPIVVDLLEQSTAGTTTGDGGALTPIPDDPGIRETLQLTAIKGNSSDAAWTAEPTAGNVHRTWTVHPQSRLLYPVPLSMPLVVIGGGRMGLRVRNYHGSTSVLLDAYMLVEE